VLEPINHEYHTGGLFLTKNIFDSALDTSSLFVDKELLRHSHVPNELPHRDSEIESIGFNLVEALKGHIPSNMILYGVTGAGKTAVIRFICDQLVAKGNELNRVVNPLILNCRNIDTQYRVLAHLGNSLIEAQILGKNIISSDCPSGPKEIIEIFNNGTLFKSENINDLIEAIESIELKEDRDVSKEIVDKFSVEKVSEQYFQLLDNLI